MEKIETRTEDLIEAIGRIGGIVSNPQETNLKVSQVAVRKDEKGVKYISDLRGFPPYIHPEEYEYRIIASSNSCFNGLVKVILAPD